MATHESRPKTIEKQESFASNQLRLIAEVKKYKQELSRLARYLSGAKKPVDHWSPAEKGEASAAASVAASVASSPPGTPRTDQLTILQPKITNDCNSTDVTLLHQGQIQQKQQEQEPLVISTTASCVGSDMPLTPSSPLTSRSSSSVTIRSSHSLKRFSSTDD